MRRARFPGVDSAAAAAATLLCESLIPTTDRTMPCDSLSLQSNVILRTGQTDGAYPDVGYEKPDHFLAGFRALSSMRYKTEATERFLETQATHAAGMRD